MDGDVRAWPGVQAQPQVVMLASATDWAGFRANARRLLAQGVQPADVSWHCADAALPDLFAGAHQAAAAPLADLQARSQVQAPGQASHPAFHVPPEFITLCQSVVLHSDPNRFGLLYRLLWRLVHEPALRHDPVDADIMRAQHLAQAVRRDMHKMKAFVRFRPVHDDTFTQNASAGPLHVAWFEPEHHIVLAVAPFFTRRFTQMRWAILTPALSIAWNGQQLQQGPGAHKADAPLGDAGEQLWLTYYQNIFNPARLKLKMMQKEMPRRYWKNLPEAQFISELTAKSSQRHLAMIEQAPTVPGRRLPLFREADAAVARQAQLAQAAQPLRTLAALNAAAQLCRNCPIGQHATQAVCGEGPARARVMVVGEQPGDQEDLRGRPLVGPSGQLFDRALADLKWPRDTLFITNAVKHFKYAPRGRQRIHKTPSQQEAAACAPWLESEIALVQPAVVIALGGTAASSLLGRPVAVMSARGQWFTRPDGVRVLVTLHPAALLRAEPHRQAEAYTAWLADLQQAAADVIVS